MRNSVAPAPHETTVRQRLLGAATDLFDRKGYAASSVREIVEAAGVTKPVLYYHFGSKEGLYLALFKEGFEALMEILAKAREREGAARERLLSLCEEVYAFHAVHLPLVRVMYSIYYGPPQGAPAFDFDATHFAFQDAVTRLLEEGMAAGEFRPVPAEDALWAVLGALNMAMEVDLCHPEMSPGREGLKRLLDIVFDGLAVPRAALRSGGPRPPIRQERKTEIRKGVRR